MAGSLAGIGAEDPHKGGELLFAGPAQEEAAATVVLLHGRGGSAADVLGLFDELAVPGLASVAPEAAGNTWYPLSFLAPLEANEPHLSSALRRVGAVVDELAARGVPAERVAVVGFSQGACLGLEFIARNARRYGAAAGICGGLIGPPGMPRTYGGSLGGTPVFLGASEPDPHIPIGRVLETAATLRAMGAEVEVRRYPGMPHAVNDDEVAACRAMLRRLVEQGGA